MQICTRIKLDNMERDNRIRISVLLDNGISPTEIMRQLGMSRATVYNVKGWDDLERKPGSGKKTILDHDEVKRAVEAAPLKSLTKHTADMGVSTSTMSRTVRSMGGKSLVRLQRPLLTPAIKEMHFQRCKGLLNNLKSARARRVIIFSDEKIWTVDPLRNRRNDCYLTFGEVDKAIRTLTMTKHPASMMSLGFVASNGLIMPLHWFLTRYQLTAADYVNILREKLILWVQANLLGPTSSSSKMRPLPIPLKPPKTSSPPSLMSWIFG